MACPWPYEGILESADSPIRRGQKIFQRDCASCHHSLTSYRDLETVSKDEVKAMATEIVMLDMPDKQVDRFAKGIACPLDLSHVTKARINGQKSVFPLLTGYRPSTGVSMGGLQYSRYFRGGALTVPKVLVGGADE
ncbi:hypothetical protein ACHQM5_010691 [Ranunculus cassubicifolius]